MLFGHLIAFQETISDEALDSLHIIIYYYYYYYYYYYNYYSIIQKERLHNAVYKITKDGCHYVWRAQTALIIIIIIIIII